MRPGRASTSRTPRRAPSSTASRGPGPRPRRSTRRWRARHGRSTARSTSRSRRRSWSRPAVRPLVCERRQHVYHVAARPPTAPGVCDIDGSPLYQRDGRQAGDHPGPARRASCRRCTRSSTTTPRRGRPARRSTATGRSTRSRPTCCARSPAGASGLTMAFDDRRVTLKSARPDRAHGRCRPARGATSSTRSGRPSARASRRSSSTRIAEDVIRVRGGMPVVHRRARPPAAPVRHTLCISHRRRGRPRHPGRAAHRARASSSPSTPAPSSTAGTATRRGPSSSARSPAPTRRAGRGDARGDAGRASPRRVPGNHLGDIAAAIEDVAAARTATAIVRAVRRPRHRHRDARGAAGHQLPHRPQGPAHRARPVPGHRADVHARRPRGPRRRRRLDRGDRDGSLAAHWEHTIAVTADGPRILTDRRRSLDQPSSP